jgi:uncharacterized protein YjbI with pentapeptide repeats
MIEIKSVGGSVLYTAKNASDIRAALREAVASGSNLRGSNLRYSNLRGSNLRYSDLSGSNLRGSDLSGSNLRGSDLSGSNLRGSDLSGSNLRYSDLSGSDLSGSDLSGSNLRGSNLSGSNLRGSDLSGSNLRGSNLSGSNLRGSDLRGSDLSGSDLSGSDLRYSDLSGSNLRGSNLRGSDLRGSNLRGSDLRGSDLSGSEGFNSWRTDDLRLLLHQTGKIRAYKLVDADYRSPIQSNGKLTYTIGSTVEAKTCDPDENKQCAAGVNIASLPWCCREWREGFRILIVEFTAKDIVAIPFATDGKFRTRRVKVVKELDLAEFGLVAPVEEATD